MTRTKANSTQNGGPERLIAREAERLVLGNVLARGVEFWRIVGPQLEPDCFAIEGYGTRA
jgi:hypothetical protein